MTETNTHRYLMKFRPLSIGTQPNGFVDYEELPADSRGYGILAYERELTDDECRDYELEAVK